MLIYIYYNIGGWMKNFRASMFRPLYLITSQVMPIRGYAGGVYKRSLFNFVVIKFKSLPPLVESYDV